MTEKQDKIDFIQRRVGDDRYETIPRRRSDKRLFDLLTPKQETAYNEIEEVHTYEMAGLPIARMRYDDIPPGNGDYELTPAQLDKLFCYQEWVADIYSKMPAVHYAVLSYLAGSSIRDIENSLRIKHGKAARYIAIGLNEYCIRRGWGDQTKPQERKIRITGIHSEFEKFGAVGFDELGRPVNIFEKNENDACKAGREGA